MDTICCVCGKALVDPKHDKKVNIETDEGKFLCKYFETPVEARLKSCQNCVKRISTLSCQLAALRSAHTKALTKCYSKSNVVSESVSSSCSSDNLTISSSCTREVVIASPIRLSTCSSLATPHKRDPVFKRFLSPATPSSVQDQKKSRLWSPKEPVVKRFLSPDQLFSWTADKQDVKKCRRQLAYGMKLYINVCTK